MKYDFKSLMAIASKNYPDEVLTTFIDKDGKFIDHVLHGDRLAMHIANAIHELADGKVSGYHGIITDLERAEQELFSVKRALIKAWELSVLRSFIEFCVRRNTSATSSLFHAWVMVHEESKVTDAAADLECALYILHQCDRLVSSAEEHSIVPPSWEVDAGVMLTRIDHHLAELGATPPEAEKGLANPEPSANLPAKDDAQAGKSAA